MIIIMLGAPGAGKGTVASILSKELNLPHVSSGDIFRKAISDKTELGVEVEGYLAQGKLVPDELTIRVIEKRLLEKDLENGVILDGFPRTVNQAEELEKFLKEHNKEVRLAVNLYSPEEEIVERVSNRRVCKNCKATYNLVLSPSKVEGICDVCGGELIQRKDDNEETIRNRLATYNETAQPIIDFYTKRNRIFNGEISSKINRFAKEVSADVLKELKGEYNVDRN